MQNILRLISNAQFKILDIAQEGMTYLHWGPRGISGFFGIAVT